jgi:large-conductance mechanosensitive channel
VLKPLVNWVLISLLGTNSLTGVFTILKGEYVDVLDDTGAVIGQIPEPTAIYIDWGAFINAIINFLMVALTLFIILKTFTSIKKRMNIKAGIQAKLDADEELNDIEKKILRKWEKRDPATAPKKAAPAPAAPAAPTEAELLTKLCALMEENIELQKTNKQ